MTLRKPILISLATVFAATACNRPLSSAKAKLKNETFATRLAGECNRMLEDFKKTERYAWMRTDLTNYPATVSLNPQVAQIITLSGTDVVEIQLTGGFAHSGIFYVPRPTAAGIQLRR